MLLLDFLERHFFGKWISYGGSYPDYNLRLFKSGHGEFVGGSVHEKPDVGGEIRRPTEDFLHHVGDSSLEFIQRNILYADLAAEI
jgi:hypothetical protein